YLNGIKFKEKGRTIMDYQKLRRLIKEGEDTKTQFKVKIDRADALAAEICAFANTQGGVLVVGVSDDGEIIGIDDINRLNQIISNAASHNIVPPIDVTTENVAYDDKILVFINVPLGQNKPYAANGTDFWVKVGADKRRATREELKRLMQ